MSNNNYNNNRQGKNKSRVARVDQAFYNPYAFVPLSDRVFNYDEAERNAILYAQDMPLSDGYSGTVTVNMEAMSPFCVRTGTVQKGKEDIGNCRLGNRYFVPATSLKGMIKSVFDIITMSNIRHGIMDGKYSMRDLKEEKYEIKQKDCAQSGLLVQIKNEYFIAPCDSWPVTYEELIDEKWGDIKEKKTVKEKYEALKSNKDPKYIFEDDEGYACMWFLSGYMKNKKHEFQFDIPDFHKAELIPVSKDTFREFRFIHESETKSKSWEFWKSKLIEYNNIDEIKKDGYKRIVPCFFRTKKDADGKKTVRDFGLARLYRQPYKKTIHDFLPECYAGDTFDMSQAVFGYVDKKEALKGRVQFTTAFIENGEPASEQTFILGSPKATFYPFYLEQPACGKHKDFFSEDAKLSGWKRYLVHESPEKGTEKQSKTTSSFIPLKAGATLSFTINVHNLHKYEIGALLAAINFCGHAECFHSLGYAKPYGYGKMKVMGMEHNLTSNKEMAGSLTTDDFIKCFVDKLCSNTGISENGWRNSINSLFLIAAGGHEREKPIRYPKAFDEFKGIKDNNQSLQDFSPLK